MSKESFLNKIVDYSEKDLKTLEKNKKHNFSSGILAATYAAAKNNDIGILTARASRQNHKPMTKLFGKITGKAVNPKHNYFVNDSELSKRLEFCGRDTAMKKLHVLVEYATGFRLNENGDFDNRKKYSSVKFYDDEEKNLKILETEYFNNYIKKLSDYMISKEVDEKKVNALISRIKVNKKNIDVYNIFDFDVSKLEATTNLKILIKKMKDKMKGGKIHFFDLDGTVFTHSVKMFVNKDGKTLFAITQEEFATDKELSDSANKILSKEEIQQRNAHGSITSYIKKAKEGKDGCSIDFKYFMDENAIKEQTKVKNLMKRR